MIVDLVFVLCIHQLSKIEGRPVLVATAGSFGDMITLRQVLPSFLKPLFPGNFDEKRIDINNKPNGGAVLTICPEGYYAMRRKV